MSRLLKLAFLATLFNFFLLSQAQAVCSTPAGEAGQVLFQTPDFLFCDGTNWLNLTSNIFETLNLGNGTTSLQVGISTPAGAGSYSLVLPTSDGNANQFLQTDGAGVLTWASVSGDNLGNHTATQNIILGSNWLSGDGGNEGLKVDASGNVTLDGQANRSLGVATAFAPATAGGDLTVKAGDGISGTANSDGGNLILSSGGITGNQGSAINFMYGPSSGVSGSTFRAPVLGMTLSANGYLGINDISPSYRLAVKDDQSGQATAMISQNANGNGLEPAMRIVRGKTSATGNALSTTGVSVDFSSYSETFSSFADFGKLIYGWEVDQTNGTTDRDSYYSIHTMQDNALAEKVRVSSAGNLGVGTSAPARKLHVAGPIRLNATTTPASPAAGDIFIDSAASNALKYYNGTAWVSLTGGGSGDFMADGSVPMTGSLKMGGNTIFGNSTASGNLTLDSTSNATKGTLVLQPLSGNVQIGSGVLSAALGITASSNGVGRIIMRNPNGGTSASSAVEAQSNLNTTGIYQYGDTATSSGSLQQAGGALSTTGSGGLSVVSQQAAAPIRFYTAGTAAGNERMRIDSAGNVGIGTTSPARPLHVAGPMRLTAATTPASPVAGDIFIDSAASNALKYYNGTAWVSLTGGGTPAGASTQLQFNNAGAFGADSNLVWDNTNKRLGVKTATPLYPLDVTGQVSVNSQSGFMNQVRLSRSDSSTQALGVQFYSTDSTATWELGVENGENAMRLHSYNGPSVPVQWWELNSGRVGIGNSSPTTRLDVTGSIRTAPVSIPAGTTTLDLSQSNYFQVAFTGNLCTGLTLNNMVEGTTYTIATNGVTGGTCSFSGTGLIFSYAPQNTTVTSDALYTMMKVGSKVYVSWINQFDVPATTGVASVTASPPLSSSGGTNPDISISQASSTTNGYLSSADWNTFNNKLSLSCAANEVPFYNGSAWICKSATPNKTASTVVYRDASADIAASTITMDDMLVGNGTTALQVALNTPSGAGSYSLTLPTTDGNSGEVLTTNGTGVLSWTNPSGAGTYLPLAGGTMTGAIQGAAGTSALPSLTVSDSGTGFYRSGVNQIGVSIAGSQKFVFSTPQMGSAVAGGGMLQAASSASVPSFSFNGDLNTGIFNPAADSIAFSTNSTERMRINSAGNVGVGTASPANPLDVVKTQNAISSIGITNLDTLGSALATFAATTNVGTMHFGASGSGASGLGIITTDIANGFKLRSYNGGPITFETGVSTTPERLRIDSAGNVGIGTTSPSRLLHVAGPMRLTASTTPASPVAGDVFIDSAASNTLKYYNGSSWVSLTGGSPPAGATNSIQWNNAGAMAGTNSIYTNGWKLGINDSSFTYHFDININNGTSYNSTGATVTPYVGNGMRTYNASPNTGTGAFTTFMATNSTPTAQHAYIGVVSQATGNTPALVIGQQTGAAAYSERMRIDSSGNVGIGTTAPGEKLEVNGNVKAAMFVSTSDERLKNNIQDIDGLESLLKLRGVTWRWNSSDQKDMGVIAQEIEEVYPWAVVTDKTSGMKAVKYDGLIAPLIESTKELYQLCTGNNELIYDIKRDVASITSDVQSIKDENLSLKSKIDELQIQNKILREYLCSKDRDAPFCR